jgi:hypothetical protein
VLQAHAEALRLAEPQEVRMSDNEQRLLLLVCVMVPGITVVMAMHLFVPHVLIPEVNGVMSFIGKDEWRDATLD